MNSPFAPALLEVTDSPYMLIAAGVFLLAGVILLIGSLRSTIAKSRVTLEDDVRRQQAENEYWRTMESAVERLVEVTSDIDTKLSERVASLEKLSSEATDVLNRLEARKANAQSALLAAPPPHDALAATGDAKGLGRVVDMKAAQAALQRRTHTAVCQLFDAGETIQDISRETGLQLGEIELILAVRDKGNASSAG